VHEPQSHDGSGIQPHVHILFSPRREDIELARTPAQWFAKAAATGHDPLQGGVRKDRSWDRKGMLYDIRASVELLTNAALAREGQALAVSAKSLEAQGLSRDPARYGSAHEQPDLDHTMAYRRELREFGVHAYECLVAYGAWQDQRAQLPSLARQFVLDRCRDHVWRYDQSPARAWERQQSLARTLDQVMTREREERWDRESTHSRERVQTREGTREPAPTAALERLRELAAALARWDDEPVAGAALNIRLRDREREAPEHDRGMGF
jgi:hypothetical protein